MTFYSYDEFSSDIKNLNPPKFDAILAIARGGLTIAHHLAEKLNIRDIFTINAISYDKTQKQKEIKIFNIPELKNYKNILIVDDISDSGETFIKILNLLKNKYPQINFKTFSIFYKSTSKFKPDFYIKETNEWIKFFWENY